MHRKKKACPAEGINFRKCQKVGHFAVVCRSKAVEKVTSREFVAVTSEDPDLFLGAVNNDLSSKDAWKVQLRVNGKDVTFKIDTGADITVMSSSTFNSLPKCPELKEADKPWCKAELRGKLHCSGILEQQYPSC